MNIKVSVEGSNNKYFNFKDPCSDLQVTIKGNKLYTNECPILNGKLCIQVLNTNNLEYWKVLVKKIKFKSKNGKEKYIDNDSFVFRNNHIVPG